MIGLGLLRVEIGGFSLLGIGVGFGILVGCVIKVEVGFELEKMFGGPGDSFAGLGSMKYGDVWFEGEVGYSVNGSMGGGKTLGILS